MSPLYIEAYNPGKKDWVSAGEVRPGDPPGSISQNKPDGEREVYFMVCKPSDKESVIYRSKGGVDIESSDVRIVHTAGLETVAVLKDGESHTFSIKTDVSDYRGVIRFTHKSERE